VNGQDKTPWGNFLEKIFSGEEILHSLEDSAPLVNRLNRHVLINYCIISFIIKMINDEGFTGNLRK